LAPKKGLEMLQHRVRFGFAANTKATHSSSSTNTDKQMVNNAHTHTRTRVAAFKNKFECGHDVIDGVNIWQENCIPQGSKAPAWLAEG